MRLRIRARLRRMRINRILKDSGCKTWYEYWLVNDPDINVMGLTPKDFYTGYTLVEVPFDIVIKQPSFHVGFHRDGTYEFREWCKVNCEDKYRIHWHKIKKPLALFDGDGIECVIAAFKNENDAARFVLTWL